MTPGIASPPAASRAALRAMAALHEACADPARLRLLNLLAAGELCVCDLVDLTALGQPFVSRHLARLRSAGLVEVARRGKFAYYRIADAALERPSPLPGILDALPTLHTHLARERRTATAAVKRRHAAPCP
jgi:DNA-binding transcriptional ArsR family regulator